MTYKPCIQFNSRGKFCASSRKIKLITPIETITYGKQEICFCKVYTYQEYYWNKKPIIDKGPERMIAFGDLAKKLQDVDYVNHIIGLDWFTNYKYENVIIGFTEYDNKSHFAYYVDIVASWQGRNANAKIKPLTEVSYIGGARFKDHANTMRMACANSLEELHELAKTLKEDEYIEYVEIRNYGPYTTYNWHTFRP